MRDGERQPSWWLLYLALPLAGVLLWLIQRAGLAGATRGLLDVGALLVVGGYTEAWRLANTARLLHHPLAGSKGEPIYYVREVTGAGSARSEGAGQPPRVIGRFYSDLFPVPMQVAEALPGRPELSGEETPA